MSRRTRDELRRMMIDAGCELVTRDGLALDPTAVTYAQVFARIEETEGVRLHRSQVHGRIWDSQEDFRGEVMEQVVARLAWSGQGLDDVVGALPEGADTPTARDWMRRGLHSSTEAADADGRYDFLTAATALTGRRSRAEDTAVARRVRANLLTRTEDKVRYYDAIADRIADDRAPAPGVSESVRNRILAQTVSAVFEGSRMLRTFDPAMTEAIELEDDHGTTTEWTYPDIAATMIFEHFIPTAEADPAG